MQISEIPNTFMTAFALSELMFSVTVGEHVCTSDIIGLAGDTKH